MRYTIDKIIEHNYNIMLDSLKENKMIVINDY
jgi:hypothetical protein